MNKEELLNRGKLKKIPQKLGSNSNPEIDLYLKERPKRIREGMADLLKIQHMRYKQAGGR